MHKVLMWNGRIDDPVLTGESDLEVQMGVGTYMVFMGDRVFDRKCEYWAPDKVCLDTLENRNLIQNAIWELKRIAQQCEIDVQAVQIGLRSTFMKQIKELRR